jgi:hypothetical protein
MTTVKNGIVVGRVGTVQGRVLGVWRAPAHIVIADEATSHGVGLILHNDQAAQLADLLTQAAAHPGELEVWIRPEGASDEHQAARDRGYYHGGHHHRYD